MKALILNSGLGSRMGELTKEHPKCMTEIAAGETILSRQLKMIAGAGIREAVITTGYYDTVLVEYCRGLGLPIHFTFVKNERYAETNYIYSIDCAREYLDDDILLMHGDLVFEQAVLERVMGYPDSCMAVSSTLPLPEKDFKAVVRDGFVTKVGIEFFEEAMAAQALYRLRREDWKLWLGEIHAFCEAGNDRVYAENALNALDGKANIRALDVRDLLCSEIDNAEDLRTVTERLKDTGEKTVYLCFSTDIIHGGHIAIIRKAQALGKLVIGVLSDEAVASYKRFPLVPASERMNLFENIAGVDRVVEQKTLSYRDILTELKPDIVVHGDDWCTGF
ncbi:MAG: NTP transferase domain-containing protein, partial [Clostridia bacterium]|nr:NTP transferase domain-containing protein [Clostridia bacterium]